MPSKQDWSLVPSTLSQAKVIKLVHISIFFIYFFGPSLIPQNYCHGTRGVGWEHEFKRTKKIEGTVAKCVRSWKAGTDIIELESPRKLRSKEKVRTASFSWKRG